MAGIDVDVVEVQTAAAKMLPLGPQVTEDGAQTVREWRRSGEFYLAPETPTLLAALDPVVRLTATAGDRIAGLGRVLTAYAEQAGPIIAELRQLRGTSPAGAQAQADQAARVAELTAKLEAIENETARAITALSDPSSVPARLKAGEEVLKAGLVVSVGWATIGQNATFKVTTFADGSVQVTASNGAELGGKFSPGVVELAPNLKLDVGSTWRFQDLPEAERMLERLRLYAHQERTVLLEPGAALGVAVLGGLEPPRPPDLVITEVKGVVNAKGEVQVGELIDATGKFEANRDYTVTRDLAAGTTTISAGREVSFQTNVDRNISSSAAGAEYKPVVSATTAGVYDNQGKLVKVLLTTTQKAQPAGTVELGGKHQIDAGGDKGIDVSGKIVDKQGVSTVTETTTAVDITDADRALAEQWLADEMRDSNGPLDDAGTYYPRTAVPGDAFQNLVHQKGTVSEVRYSDRTSQVGVEGKVDVGPEVGLKATVDQNQLSTEKVEVLGPIGADGERRPVPVPN